MRRGGGWIAPLLLAVGLLVVVWVAVGFLPLPAEAGAAAPNVVIRQVQRDAMGAVLALHDGDCVSSADIFFRAPDLGQIDLALLVQPWRRGWFETGRRVYLGSLPDFAAAIGAVEVAIGPQDTWARLLDGSAQQVVQLQTPAGRMVWATGSAAEMSRC